MAPACRSSPPLSLLRTRACIEAEVDRNGSGSVIAPIAGQFPGCPMVGVAMVDDRFEPSQERHAQDVREDCRERSPSRRRREVSICPERGTPSLRNPSRVSRGPSAYVPARLHNALSFGCRADSWHPPSRSPPPPRAVRRAVDSTTAGLRKIETPHAALNSSQSRTTPPRGAGRPSPDRGLRCP